MFNSRILDSSSRDKEQYTDEMLKAFPKAHIDESTLCLTKDVAVFEGPKIIGGISFIEHHPFSEDIDIVKSWEVVEDLMGTRLLRFWTTNPSLQKYIMAIVFKRIMEVVRPGTYYYGILSISLDYAQKKEAMFKNHHKYLNAKTPLEQCSWDDRNHASSNGVALIGVYRRLRGELLGPPAGCKEDGSVKIAMGSLVEKEHFIGVIPQV